MLLDSLEQLLQEQSFQSLRQQLPNEAGFCALYDSLKQIVANAKSQDDAALREQLKHLLTLYQLVARSQYNDVFFAPQLAVNQLAWALTALVAETDTDSARYAVLYARSLTWPDQRKWVDHINSTDQLPEHHGTFAIAANGEICQLDHLIDTVCEQFSAGQRNLTSLWQSNDARNTSQALPTRLLQALQTRSPAFKAFYEHIATIARTDTPYGKLQALRVGLYDGSVNGTNSATRGSNYDAGSAANEAISVFALWWEDIHHVRHASGKSLKQVLGELPTGSDRNLEQLLAIIIREQSANISLSSDANTCVQVRGSELEEAIRLNRKFLNTFENHGLIPQKLQHYKTQISTELNQLDNAQNPPLINTNASLTLSESSEQQPYYRYAVCQLWQSFCEGVVSDAVVLELAQLLTTLNLVQRTQLWNAPFDCKRHEVISDNALRRYLLALDTLLAENSLLPPSERHTLSAVDQALITIVAHNSELLAWTSTYYECILFSHRHLVNLALTNGLQLRHGKSEFRLQDEFNLAYYIDQKTRGNTNGSQRRAAFHALLELADPTEQPLISPLHRAIKNGDLQQCQILLQTFPASVTHIEWHSGNSSLGLAASYGQTELCTQLLELGIDPKAVNKTGKVAEELWQKAWCFKNITRATNPLITFHQNLMRVARNATELTSEQQQYFIQHTHLLTWHLKDKYTTFLNTAFNFNNLVVIQFLMRLPNWLTLVIRESNLSLLHIIAAQGNRYFFPQLDFIPIDDQNNTHQSTPLHIAVFFQQEDFCKLLLQRHAKCDLKNAKGCTALMIAALKGYESLCKLLLLSGADPTLKNTEGRTALELWSEGAMTNPLLTLHQELIALAKKTIDFSDRELQLIELVAQYPHLLTWQATQNGDHFLSTVITENNSVLFDVLLKSSAKQCVNLPDATGRTALHHAALHGRTDMCKTLLENGTKLDLQDDEGNSALMLAMQKGHTTICQQLCAAGVNLSLKNKRHKTALELWPQSLAANPLIFLHRELMALTLDTPVLTQRQEELLVYLAKYSHVLSWQSGVEKKTTASNSHWHGSIEVSVYLLDELFIYARVLVIKKWLEYSLTSINDTHGPLNRTPMHFAAFYGQEAICQFLLEHKCDIDVQDSEGNSALMLAMRQGHTSICQLLLNNGANINLKNKDKKNALELWSKDSVSNPLQLFYHELIALAKTISELTESQRKLLSLIVQHTELLSWQLHPKESSFLQTVFAYHNVPLIQTLARLPQWRQLSNNSNSTLSVLHISASRDYTDLYPYAKAIDIDNQNNALKRSALHLAALYNRHHFCRLLLDGFAKIDLQDAEGNSALMLAALKGHTQICQDLLARGADPWLKNLEGKTAEELWPLSHPARTNPLTLACRVEHLNTKKTAVLNVLTPTLAACQYFLSSQAIDSAKQRDQLLAKLREAIQSAHFEASDSQLTADDVLNRVIINWRRQHHASLSRKIMAKIATYIAMPQQPLFQDTETDNDHDHDATPLLNNHREPLIIAPRAHSTSMITSAIDENYEDIERNLSALLQNNNAATNQTAVTTNCDEACYYFMYCLVIHFLFSYGSLFVTDAETKHKCPNKRDDTEQSHPYVDCTNPLFVKNILHSQMIAGILSATLLLAKVLYHYREPLRARYSSIPNVATTSIAALQSLSQFFNRDEIVILATERSEYSDIEMGFRN